MTSVTKRRYTPQARRTPSARLATVSPRVTPSRKDHRTVCLCTLDARRGDIQTYVAANKRPMGMACCRVGHLGLPARSGCGQFCSFHSTQLWRGSNGAYGSCRLHGWGYGMPAICVRAKRLVRKPVSPPPTCRPPPPGRSSGSPCLSQPAPRRHSLVTTPTTSV